MRIDMISEHASPLAVLGGVDAGGQNVHVAELAKQLGARAHQVTVYTRRDRPVDQLPTRVPLAHNVTVVHVPVGPPAALPKDEFLPFMDEFADWVRDDWAAHQRPDIVHAHFWMSGVAAMRLADATGVPMAQTFHALGTVKRRYQPREDTSPAERIDLERKIAERADVVIATCRDEVQEIAAMGVDTSRTVVVPCGVDLQLFARVHDDRMPRTHTGTLLLTVARLVPRKGVETIVRALPHLPTARLLVVGGPRASEVAHDPEVRRLRRVARSVGVTGRVQFAGGVAHEKMPDLYRMADIVVADPWYEPFGITPVEAAACARPVIGSAVGGLLDTIVPEQTGLLVPPKDPDALAHAIARLAGSPRLMRVWGLQAAERAHERYGWERVAADTEAALARAVAQPVAEKAAS